MGTGAEKSRTGILLQRWVPLHRRFLGARGEQNDSSFSPVKVLTCPSKLCRVSDPTPTQRPTASLDRPAAAAGSAAGAAASFFGETSGYAPLYVDPSRGAILTLETRKKTLMEFYHEGKEVGYAITVLLIIGLLIALERMIVLGSMSAKINAQTKNLDQPNENNPLGRLLKVYFDNKSVDAETLELKLDEAILRETPTVDRGITLIKMFAAIAPLMGLLGTVIGMILTFQTITLFGTGDPKIMAGNISLALVTTALGLIAALPLILVHSIVAGKSKAVLHKLDEQSAGIIAAIAEKESN